MKINKRQLKKLIREEKLLILEEDNTMQEFGILAEEAYLINESKTIMLMLKPLFIKTGKKIVPILLELLKDAGKDVIEELVKSLGEKMAKSA